MHNEFKILVNKVDIRRRKLFLASHLKDDLVSLNQDFVFWLKYTNNHIHVCINFLGSFLLGGHVRAHLVLT